MQKIAFRLGLWYVKRRLRIATVDRRSPTLVGKLQWMAAGAGLAFAAGALIKPRTRRTAATAAATVKEKAVDVARSPGRPEVDLPDGVRMEVEDGIAFLHGEVPSAAVIGETVRRVEQVDGVRAVQSLLTLPAASAA